MTSVSAFTIRLCALLLLCARSGAQRRTPCRDARHLSTQEDTWAGSRCVSESELKRRVEKEEKRFNASRVPVPVAGARACDQLQEREDTCTQVVQDLLEGGRLSHETNLRSLSPWELCIHRDEDRVPRDISVARCLCQGCITHQGENSDYNSVPVCVRLTVLRRKKCPRDPSKFVVRRDRLSVPVACTCVRPAYARSRE